MLLERLSQVTGKDSGTGGVLESDPKQGSQHKHPPADEWTMKMMGDVHEAAFHSAVKENESVNLEWKWMELGTSILSGVAQVQENKPCIFFLICGS